MYCTIAVVQQIRHLICAGTIAAKTVETPTINLCNNKIIVWVRWEFSRDIETAFDVPIPCHNFNYSAYDHWQNEFFPLPVAKLEGFQVLRILKI